MLGEDSRATDSDDIVGVEMAVCAIRRSASLLMFLSVMPLRRFRHETPPDSTRQTVNELLS